MYTTQQNALESVQNRLELGELTQSQANVELVRLEGVREVRGRIPRGIRKDLNDAVKRGDLGRIRKDGFMPEVYFHPNSEANAKALRRRRHNEGVSATKGVFCSAKKD